METIEIALAADGGYFDQLFVTATSMAAYCRTDDAELRFNILDGGIREDDWAYLVEKVNSLHEKSSFNRIPVDQALFGKFPTWNGNRMAYARLLLPEVLKDVDWVLYSDCDFLWLRDVTELWKERDNAFAVLAVRDAGSWESKERTWFSKNGFDINGRGRPLSQEGSTHENYFCSGMCLFNLKRFREEKIIEKTASILEQHQDVPFVDQTALNVTCAGAVKLVDEKWMRFTHFLTPETHALPSVIHHAGEVPWRFVRRTQPLSDTMLLWHRFNAKVRDISLWCSLRRYFSPAQIVAHRLIALCSRCALTRAFVLLLCKSTRHMGAFYFFKLRGVKYALP